MSASPDATNLIRRSQTDPLWFCSEILQLKAKAGEPTLLTAPDESWEVDIWQAELMEAVADVWRLKMGLPTVVNHEGKTQISVRSSHGPGKTFGIAMLAHWFNFCFPGRVLATAPKFSQVKTQLFAEFRKIRKRAQPWYQTIIDCGEIKASWFKDPDWCMLADSASNPENIAGKHWQYLLVLVDESSGVPESLWPVIEGALSVGVMLILVMISNPTKNTGTFAASHLKAETARDYYRMHVRAANSLRIQNSEAKRSYVERMERKYGRESPVVKVRCYGEFASEDVSQLIALEWLQGARDRADTFDVIKGDGSLPKLRVSIDCGAGGSSETVVTAVRHYMSVRVGLKQTRNNYALAVASKKTADEAERLFFLFGGTKGEDDFVVDSLGVGVGAAGELYSRGHKVVMYQGGAGSDDKLRWRCRRVQSYMNVRNDLRDRCVVLLESFFDDRADWDEFDAQMCSIKSPPGAERVEDLITKQQMVAQGIPSPDMADSWAMQYATQSPQMVTRTIARDNNMDMSADSSPAVHESKVWEEF